MSFAEATAMMRAHKTKIFKRRRCVDCGGLMVLACEVRRMSAFGIPGPRDTMKGSEQTVTARDFHKQCLRCKSSCYDLHALLLNHHSSKCLREECEKLKKRHNSSLS